MKNKKLISMVAIAAMTASIFAGCGQEEDPGTAGGGFEGTPIVTIDETGNGETTTPEPTTEPAFEVPADCYLSELTGLPISKDIKNQRPIAVMVDNETTALPHYGIAECDIVYELMNSTANDRVTRLMCVRKDWQDLDQMGSIRSTRPTNISLAGEYNAVLIHDGGPVYINEFIAKPYCNHISSGFYRADNGKSWEYSEYVTGDDRSGRSLSGGSQDYLGLANRMAREGIGTEYNSYAPVRDSHFLFRDYGTDMTCTEMGYSNVQSATNIQMPTFKHTKSQLIYNEETSTYDYYLYGDLQKDAEDDQVVSFNNVILQCTDYYVYDEHGYLLYYYIDPSENKQGWYITNGEAIKVTWDKPCTNDKLDYEQTRFYDENGCEIMLNPGKTYIALVPKDGWGTVTLN